LQEQRTRIWIDRFQTSLSLRIASYFVVYQIAVWSAVLTERAFSAGMERLVGETAAGYCFVFFAIVVLCLGLLFIYDAVRFAHRVVGPLYRVRKVVKALAAGEELEEISLRQGDMLQDLKDDFNEMLKVLEQRGVVVLKTTPANQDQGKPVSV